MAHLLNEALGPLAPHPYLLVAAVVLDLIIGDPPYAWHPIRLVGRALTWIEEKLRAAGFDGYGGGIMLLVALTASALLIVTAAIRGAAILSSYAAWAVHAFVLYSLLALGDLFHHVRKIESAV